VESGAWRIEKITLFDIFGRWVFEIAEMTFDISHFPVGIYFARIETKREAIMKKVIKQ
jgi:hypothetical protein